ncbi:unnamed protein product [Trichobilharzia regenti]|nr:unnamed protein product [Trichobilharzia regenti]
MLEDNEKEEKIIKQLSKKLKMNRKNLSKKKKKTEKSPLWLRQCGFDCNYLCLCIVNIYIIIDILDFEKQMNAVTTSEENDTTLCTTVGVLPEKKKNKKTLDLYGQNTSGDNDDASSSDSDDDQPMDDVLNEQDNSSELCDSVVNQEDKEEEEEEEEEEDISMDSDNESLCKSIRNSLNRLSESQMSKIITELCGLFTKYPRATVRSCIIEEACNLIECTQVNRNSKMGWLHQELAVCLTCVQLSLYSLFQSAPLIGYLIESIIFRLFPQNHGLQQQSPGVIISYSVFLAYLYRFGVSSLILDILKAYLCDCDSGKVKAGHFITIAVGVNLRKFNLNRCQEIIHQANDQLIKCKSEKSELSYDLEGLIQRLSEKRSTEECVTRSMHLHKLMRVWTKGMRYYINYILNFINTV